MKQLSLLFLSLMIVFGASAQKAEDQIEQDNFDPKLIEDIVMERVNQYRSELGFNDLKLEPILSAAAKEQAESNAMAKRIDNQDEMGPRVEDAGGTENANGVAAYGTAKRGKDKQTYSKVAEEIFDKMTKSSKNKRKLAVEDYFYGGIAAVLSDDGKRVYVSVAMGGVDALNPGADKLLRKSLPLKYNKSKKGLSPGDKKACKNCDKFNNWEKLYKGVFIKGNKVYLEYDNLKELKKLLKRDGDGLFIDIIQREQYPCGGANIYNNSIQTKGVISKPYYSAKIFKKNEIEGKRIKTYSGEIGKLKKKVVQSMPKNAEVNLVIVQDKKVCRVVTRTFLEEGKINTKKEFTIHPDTTTNDALDQWAPKADKTTLEFTIPFAQSESEYDVKYVKPFLAALNEPKYNIDEIFIEAQSSLEGDSATNAKLQQKRAESIITSIEKVSGEEGLLKDENIAKSDGWDFFQDQIAKDEKYAKWRDMSKEEVKAELRKRDVFEELKPLLEEQRFAKVVMNITYDISGAYEQPFVLAQLRKAVDDKQDGALALRIQKFAMGKIMEGAYNAQNFIDIDIPANEQFASLKVNQAFLDHKINHKAKLDEDNQPGELMQTLYDVAAANPYVAYNKHMLNIKFGEIENEAQIRKTQSDINRMYTTEIPQDLMDNINLEYQFKVMDFMDSVGVENEMVQTSLEKIKKIFNIEDASWQSALKLGYIFMDAGELKYAGEIMAPFIGKETALTEEFYFTYISIVTHNPKNFFGKAYTIAMEEAKKKNPERFCKLFGEPYISFQMMDNPNVKELYCGTCK